MAIYFQGQAMPVHTPEEIAQMEREREAAFKAGIPSWVEQWAAQTDQGYEIVKVSE